METERVRQSPTVAEELARELRLKASRLGLAAVDLTYTRVTAAGKLQEVRIPNQLGVNLMVHADDLVRKGAELREYTVGKRQRAF